MYMVRNFYKTYNEVYRNVVNNVYKSLYKNHNRVAIRISSTVDDKVWHGAGNTIHEVRSFLRNIT